MPEQYTPSSNDKVYNGVVTGKQVGRIGSQIVDSQGNIQNGPWSAPMHMGDWNDWQAYKAAAISQQEQRAYDLSLWKYQQAFMNDYNSPAAQMSRYGEAGLNPNLIYGQQNTASFVNQQDSTPLKTSSNAGRQQRINQEAFQAMSQNLMGVASMILDIEKQKEQLNLMKAQTSYAQEQAGGLALENSFKRWFMGEGGESPRARQEIQRYKNLVTDQEIKEAIKQLYGSKKELTEAQILQAYMYAALTATNKNIAEQTFDLEKGMFEYQPWEAGFWKSLLFNAVNFGEKVGEKKLTLPNPK